MSYPLSHTSTKYISLTPVAHYDFSKLNLTVGTPISSVPSQTSGASLSSLNLSECPVMAENILADGTTVRVASFTGAQKMFTFTDTPVLSTASDELTMIVVATGTNSTGGGGGAPMSVWNRTSGPHGGYNSMAIGTNSYRSFWFGNNRNIYPGARSTYSDHKQLNFVEGQWFETAPAQSGDTVGYTTRHGATISTQMHIGTDVECMSAYGTYDSNTQWTGTTHELIVGARNHGSTTLSNGAWYYYIGHVAEVLVFDGLLTSQDRQKVRDYIQEKYDIRRAGMVGDKCLQLDGPSQYAVMDAGNDVRGSQLRSDYHAVTGTTAYPGTKFYNQVFDYWLNLEEEHQITNIPADEHTTPGQGRYSILSSIRCGNYASNGHDSYKLYMDLHGDSFRLYSPGWSTSIGPKYYFPRNRWVHIRVGLDYVSGSAYLWVDGELTGTKATDHSTYYYFNKTDIQGVVFGDAPSLSPYGGDASPDSILSNRIRSNYKNSKQKIAGMRVSKTKEPLSDANFIPPPMNSLPDTTPGGDFTVARDDMGLKPLYEKIVTTDDTTRFPKLHGKWQQSTGSVFGSNLYAQSRNMPDLLDFSNPNLKSAFRYCHVNLNHNQIKTLAPLRDVFTSASNPVQSYHLYLNDNQLSNFKDMKGSSFFNNGNWYHLRLENNPITSFDGLQEINSLYTFYAYSNRCLQHVDHLDEASWDRLNSIQIYNCPNLLTITPSAFQGMPKLVSINMYNNYKLTTAPVLHFDGIDQSDNWYYAHFYNCNITDFTPLKSPRLYRLDNYNQQHTNDIDMDWLGDCELLWEWNGSSNNYNLAKLPDLVNTRLNRVFLNYTNIDDLTFLTTARKNLRPAGVTSVMSVTSNDALYDTLHIYHASLSATHMSTLGADPTKRISIIDELQIQNNPEIRDLRVFENSFQFPGRSSWHAHVSHHYARVNNCNLTNDSYSIGAMRQWWQCLRLYVNHNPNLTSLSELFTNNTSVPRATYYDNRSFTHVYANNCEITDVSWMLNDSFAGVKTIDLRYNPIDHAAVDAIATQLVALKTAGSIRLETIDLRYTTWDQKHWGGGWWYIYYATHSHTIKNSNCNRRTPTGEIGADGWVYTTSLSAAEYFRCTNDGAGTSLSVQAQTAKTLHDAGIEVWFNGLGSSWNHSTQGTHYSPHALPSRSSQWGAAGWTCPIPYPPTNA